MRLPQSPERASEPIKTTLGRSGAGRRVGDLVDSQSKRRAEDLLDSIFKVATELVRGERASLLLREDNSTDFVIARIVQAPVKWRLAVTIGEPADPTDDATTPWPSNREHFDVGTLTIDHVEGEAPGNCRDVNFDPLVLPLGIEPSDDPLLSTRSAAYSTSFTRRAGETKEPSAVQPPASGKGA